MKKKLLLDHLQARIEMTPDVGFWNGRRVFLTGHTGFKGAWLALWLQNLGAKVTAFSLEPPTKPSLFDLARIHEGLDSRRGDIRDPKSLTRALRESRASVVFHLAAQATVADGYRDARGTFATNLTGTLNLLDAIRACPGIDAALIVTSDKCYAPGSSLPLAEDAPMGGRDPYSASKSCAEIAVQCWRESFFAATDATCLATARAGNVIGGGDFSAHRLLPDLVRAFAAGNALTLRMPEAVRPWQHVLDALHGYLMLAERLAADDGEAFATGWNFGPSADDQRAVADVANRAAALWGSDAKCTVADANFQKETLELRLNPGQAHRALGWQPRLDLDAALRYTIDWYRSWIAGADMRTVSVTQLDTYLAAK